MQTTPPHIASAYETNNVEPTSLVEFATLSSTVLVELTVHALAAMKGEAYLSGRSQLG